MQDEKHATSYIPSAWIWQLYMPWFCSIHELQKSIEGREDLFEFAAGSHPLYTIHYPNPEKSEHSLPHQLFCTDGHKKLVTHDHNT